MNAVHKAQRHRGLPGHGVPSIRAPRRWRRPIAALDGFLRRRMGVFDISTDPTAILRLQLAHARTRLVGADGTVVERGEPLGRLHFVNENLPSLPAEGPTMSWALRFGRALQASLRTLASYLHAHQELDDIKLFQGEFGFITAENAERTVVLAERFGFEFTYGRAPGLRFWQAGFWENLGTWLMLKAFNTASLETKSFTRLVRAQVLMTRATLMKRYGPGADAAAQPRP